jgi:hypothetical protein
MERIAMSTSARIKKLQKKKAKIEAKLKKQQQIKADKARKRDTAVPAYEKTPLKKESIMEKEGLHEMIARTRKEIRDKYFADISKDASLETIVDRGCKAYEVLDKGRHPYRDQRTKHLPAGNEFNLDVWHIAEQLKKKEVDSLKEMPTQELAKKIGDTIVRK